LARNSDEFQWSRRTRRVSNFAHLNTLGGGPTGAPRPSVTPEGRHLDAQERQPIPDSSRHQILEDDRAMDRLELDTPERENAWVKDFIGRLSDVLRNVSKP
jgi:hypothetical protein